MKAHVRFLFVPLLFALAVLPLACGSGSRYIAPELRGAEIKPEPVAILPFDSLSGHPNAGQILSEFLETELRAQGINLIPRELVATKLAPLAGETKTPTELGALLQAKTIILGSVTEYRYKRGAGETPVIGVTVRLIDAQNGDILWSATRNQTGRSSLFVDDSLSRLAHGTMREIARTLSKEIHHDQAP